MRTDNLKFQLFQCFLAEESFALKNKFRVSYAINMNKHGEYDMRRFHRSTTLLFALCNSNGC